MIIIKKLVSYDSPNENRETNDFYSTPIEEVVNILSYENLIGQVLEPSCGTGNIVKGILETGYKKNIIATDLIDRGFGIGNLDFLSNEYPYTKDIGTIIINPPYSHITEFVIKSCDIANGKVIVLARSLFVEGKNRYLKIFKDNPPTRIYQYVDRICCYKNDKLSEMNSAMAFSWLVWDLKDNSKTTTFKWLRRYSERGELK